MTPSPSKLPDLPYYLNLAQIAHLNDSLVLTVYIDKLLPNKYLSSALTRHEYIVLTENNQ